MKTSYFGDHIRTWTVISKKKSSSPCFPISVRLAASTVFPNLTLRVKYLPTPALFEFSRLVKVQVVLPGLLHGMRFQSQEEPSRFNVVLIAFSSCLWSKEIRCANRCRKHHPSSSVSLASDRVPGLLVYGHCSFKYQNSVLD